MPDQTSSLISARPEPAAPRPRRAGGPALIVAAAVLWGTTGTASSLAPAGAPPAAIGAAGLFFGGLLLFFSAPGARALWRKAGRGDRLLLAAGAVAVAGYPLTFYPAVSRSGVAVATVTALGSAPVFAGLLGWLAGQGRPAARWAGATAAAVAGCAALVLGPWLAGGGPHGARGDLAGVALAACAGLSYAVYSLIGGKLIARGHPAGAVMGAMFGAAAAGVLPVLLAEGGGGWLLSVRGAAVSAHLAVVTTFLAYRLFGYGLRRTTAQTATTLTLAEPAVGTALGVAVLGERLPALSWSGLAALAAGLAIAALPGKKPGRAAEPPGRLAAAMPREKTERERRG